MKVKELIKKLETYDPEYDMMIALPPGWYKEEDTENEEIWEKDGWSLDSIDYVIISDKNRFASVCPINAPKEIE